MKQWFVIKLVKAKSLKEAIKNEGKGEVIQVAPAKGTTNIEAIGFEIGSNFEDDGDYE
jgi:hypothetical protein